MIDTYGELKRKLEKAKEENAAKDACIALLTDENNELNKKDALADARIALLTDENQLLNNELNNKDALAESKSLHAVVNETPLVVALSCNGTLSSHMQPSNHDAAVSVFKDFNQANLNTYIDALKLKTGGDPKLKEQSSQLIGMFIVENPIVTPVPTPNCPNEAATAAFVNLGLYDVTAICNAILQLIAATTDPPRKVAVLQVRPEMSIFSNRVDHVVVFDHTSNVPLFCVETKKDIDEKFKKNKRNRALGQAFDQLNAMRLEGQPCPLGALTCFNTTYLTCLDTKIAWDVLPSFERLRATIVRILSLPQPNTTPPPLKVEQAVVHEQKSQTRSTQLAKPFIADKGRSIVRSKEYVDHQHFVSALVVIVLNALQENYKPISFQLLTQGDSIDVLCIKMTRGTYEWGNLRTAYQGPYRRPDTPSGTFIERLKSLSCKSSSIHTDLYLLQCIGTGSTSKVYHAITEDDCDCVVKLYVQRHKDDGSLKGKKTSRRIP